MNDATAHSLLPIDFAITPRPPLVHLLVDDLTGEAIRALLEEHLEDMRRISPPGTAFALDLDGLRAPSITVWSAWEEGALVGCCALKQLDIRSGEIKSMRTARQHRGRGIASEMIEHLVDVARDRGYATLFLETGATEHFHAARSLYQRHGFVRCAAFGDYDPDLDHSTFMTLRLPGA